MDDRFHLFVADPQNHCVRHFSAFGRHLGDLGRDAGAARGDRPGVLSHPTAVAVFHDDVYVACGERPLRRGVQRLSRDGRTLTPLRSTGDPEQEFGAPRGIWADRRGVLVADTLHGRIQRFRLGGAFLASVSVSRGDERARPISVARAADGRLLAVDAGDRPGLRVFEPDGTAVAAADLATHNEQAIAVSVDAGGRVYVLDKTGERVQRFHSDLTFDATIVDLAEHLDDFPPGPP